MPELTCATWNVHRAKGRDGRVDPARVEQAIAQVIVPHSPDVLALQEADEECRPHAGIFDIARIAAESGLSAVHDRADLRWGPESHGFLGTILFLHPRFARTRSDVIDLPGHCHRGAIAVETETEGHPCRIISTHLSLSQSLRMVQMRTLGQYIRRRPKMQTILLGDTNEWRPWSGAAFSRWLVGTRLSGPAAPTFPAGRPFLPLDRIMTDAPGRVGGLTVINRAETNLASDHRPVVAKVTVA